MLCIAMTLEMDAEPDAYCRPAADAFDLPAFLAARERRAAGGRRRSNEHDAGVEPADVAQTLHQHVEPSSHV